MPYADSRVLKRAISMSTGNALPCCWLDCVKVGYLNNALRAPEGDHIVIYVFCSERHRQYFRNSHREFGKLPAGFKLVH